MHWLDALFFSFFASFIPISWFIDATALGFRSWPPKATRKIVLWWINLCDPLLGQPPLWFRAMTWFEVTVYPIFCAAFCYAIYKGLTKCRWVRIPAIVFASMVGYSFLFIVAEYVFGPWKCPAPILFTSVYVPYFILPILFAYRTYHPAKVVGRKKGSVKETKSPSFSRETRRTSGHTRRTSNTSSNIETVTGSVKKEDQVVNVDEPRRLRNRQLSKKTVGTGK
eukprot:jgi/Galph1/1953/GphlegSOOS_G637.1